MEQILRGSFGVNSRLSKLNRKQGVVTRCGLFVTLRHGPQLRDAWNYSTLQHIRRGRTPLSLYVSPSTIPKRNFGLLFRAVKKVLKLRYLLLGGAVSGSLTLQKAYEDWKNNLPDLQWLDDVFPDSDKWKSFGVSLIEIKDKIKENVEMDSRLKQLIHTKYENYKDWFNNRLDKALEAAEESSQTESISWGFLQTIFPELDPKKSSKGFFDTSNEKKVDYVKKRAADVIETADRNGRENTHHPVGSNNMESIRFAMHLNKGTVGEGSQREMLHIQLKYQKELEKLEKENKELRKQLLLNKKDVATKKIKKSLIDMYSDVLDELSEYDSSYNTQDHLPRVVVVGDQSSGKTSVLEMVAQARIFPRGAGEMMTRAPVKVTLSEGPYHIAQFKDSAREFDLTKESDLAELRKEVEIRMKNSVRGGKTVSQEVISMSVKGPGLQRMVLVDLPGIISTVTKEMASDTREAIRKMTETYMSNPNAIILCIQDGSVDAERSNVTDLVSHVDPQGKRTIFVLTKVDLAEDNLTNPERIKKILSGKLFPMKALGYFAVVTGRGRKDESIQDIRDYEQQFFRNSKLFSDGLILSSQLTTRNLSLAVAECFWKMVRETVEQQADAFKATRFNLEAEWKNNFPRLRELDRDELFERARGEMLDEVINLSQVSPKQWEELLEKKLWEKVSTYVFENIYLTAAQSGETGQFKTTVDIKLKQWVEQQLAVKSVESGWEVLREEFANFLNKTKNSKERDSIFDELKTAVFNEAIERHTWEDKAFETLRAIQMNTLEDRSVSEKEQWDSAIKFFETSIRDRLEQNKSTLKQMFGPGFLEKWTYWKYLSPEQSTRSKIKKELDRLLSVNPRHGPSLSYEELAAIRKNLQNEEINVEMEFIKETWHPVYRNHFLNKSLGKSYECKKDFYIYQQGLESEVECSDVVLFWRLEQMLKVTSHALRQQIMNREARRLEKEIKEILEEYSQDQAKKEKLLTGRRVTLAEELKRVRQIQEKLEEFIQALNKEN